MPRTTEPAVKETLGNNYDVTIPLGRFVLDGSGIVDSLIEYNTAHDGLTLSVILLESIERYLACHLYSLADQIFKYKQTGSAAATFQGETGMGFKSSLYGQTAMELDPTGYLAKRSAQAEDVKLGGGIKKAGMFWAGTESTE